MTSWVFGPYVRIWLDGRSKTESELVREVDGRNGEKLQSLSAKEYIRS